MADLKQTLKQLRSARDSLVGEITALDSQISERHAARSALTSGPVSRADFLGYIKADMDRRGARFAQFLMRQIADVPRDYGTLTRINNGRSKLNIHYLTGIQSPLDMTEDAVYFYFSHALVARLETELDALDWPESIATVAERAPLIVALDAEIAALAKQREDLAASLTDAGLAG